MANVKISGLPAAASVASTDQFETNQSGTSRRATASQISDFVKTVAPAFSTAVPAFGVQQNNATGKVLIVAVMIALVGDHLSPGNQEVQAFTNQGGVTPVVDILISQDGTTDFRTLQTVTIVVPPGGWYRVDNIQDPGVGNAILGASIWAL